MAREKIFYSRVSLTYHPPLPQKRFFAEIFQRLGTLGWTHWLFQAKKKHGIDVLNVMATPNHIRLLATGWKQR